MFKLVSKYTPSGDQPQAIDALVKGINEGKKHQVLLGATGTGKTFTIANVIAKTKKLIDSFESSELISKLDYYKRIVIGNKELLDLIKRYNNSTDNYEKLSLKEKIYKYDEYREYMKYYNELFYYIMGINKRFKEYTNVRGCHI